MEVRRSPDTQSETGRYCCRPQSKYRKICTWYTFLHTGDHYLIIRLRREGGQGCTGTTRYYVAVSKAAKICTWPKTLLYDVKTYIPRHPPEGGRRSAARGWPRRTRSAQASPRLTRTRPTPPPAAPAGPPSPSWRPLPRPPSPSAPCRTVFILSSLFQSPM